MFQRAQRPQGQEPPETAPEMPDVRRRGEIGARWPAYTAQEPVAAPDYMRSNRDQFNQHILLSVQAVSRLRTAFRVRNS